MAHDEQQPYRVVARHPGFELRRYPAHLVAELRVDGSFLEAGNVGFRPLAAYISGANRSRRKVGMTAPVVQESAGSEQIARTAPVVQEEGERPGCWVVRFVLPAALTAATAPEPEDPRITVREVPHSSPPPSGSPAGGARRRSNSGPPRWAGRSPRRG